MTLRLHECPHDTEYGVKLPALCEQSGYDCMVGSFVGRNDVRMVLLKVEVCSAVLKSEAASIRHYVRTEAVVVRSKGGTSQLDSPKRKFDLL